MKVWIKKGITIITCLIFLLTAMGAKNIAKGARKIKNNILQRCALYEFLADFAVKITSNTARKASFH